MSHSKTEKGTLRRVNILIADRVEADRVRLTPLDADPADAVDGDVWYNADDGVIRVKVGATTKTVAFV